MSQMVRVLLVRHAPTAATLRGAFPGDEPLEPDGRAAAAALRDILPKADRVLSSPARRCRETAAAAGLEPELDPRLAECDFGDWTGRTLAEIEPDVVAEWLADRTVRHHGGESLAAFGERVTSWLQDAGSHRPGCTVAFTHAGVIKAAVVHVLGGPPVAYWRIHHAPLAITELRRYDEGWSVACVNSPAEAMAE